MVLDAQAQDSEAEQAAAAAESAHAKLQFQADQLHAKLEAAVADNAQLQGSVADLHTQLEDKLAMEKQLHEVVEGLRASLSNSESVCKKLGGEVEALKAELSAAIEQVSASTCRHKHAMGEHANSCTPTRRCAHSYTRSHLLSLTQWIASLCMLYLCNALPQCWWQQENIFILAVAGGLTASTNVSSDSQTSSHAR